MICKKVPYSTRKEALLVPEIYGRPYRCHRCGMWHVGHKLPRKHPDSIRIKKDRRAVRRMCHLLEQMCGCRI